MAKFSTPKSKYISANFENGDANFLKNTVEL
jgi:hypothetical protein